MERGISGARPGADAFSLKSGVAKKKFSISGEAFGVGVYEEDDEDVYSRYCRADPELGSGSQKQAT